MIIGILADSHDHLDNLRKALHLFRERKVEHIIHAGDFTSAFTWRVLQHFPGGFTGIFGNNDGERVLLKKLYQGRIFAQPYRFTLHRRRIVVMHEPDVVDALADSGHFDLVVYGHTHEPVVRKAAGTLVVNPGETCGWLYENPTAAVVDLERMEAEVLPVR
ncbi:MAG: metallophosphoesterase [Thermodesulfovibrionales bacterium]